MVREKKPSFLFLMETLSKHKRLEPIRIKLGFVGLFVVDPVGRCKGLALLWKEVEELEIQNYSRRHINAIVKLEEDTHPWKLIGFYGHPNTAKRSESWALLKHLKEFSPIPWLCIGDFNKITQ